MIKGKETKLGKKISEAGFPYCYSNKGWLKHCPSCLKSYKYRIKNGKTN